MSQSPLSEQDYTDGEIHKLIPGSPIWQALHSEDWWNCGPETKMYYLDRLAQEYYFAGYIVSLVRGQVELTYIPFNLTTGGPGKVQMIAITLSNVRRFLTR